MYQTSGLKKFGLVDSIVLRPPDIKLDMLPMQMLITNPDIGTSTTSNDEYAILCLFVQ